MASFLIRPSRKPLRGAVAVPGDKSIGHRSLLFGALSETPVRVTGLGGGADNASTRRAIEAMGVRVEDVDDGGGLVVHGVGVDGLTAPGGDIDCGNSGTTMRLLCGLLAGQRFASRLVGDESLTRRPMRRVVDPLARMRARIEGQGGPKEGEVYPPLELAGRSRPHPEADDGWLEAIEYEMPVASAQVKSAVLLAGLYADGTTRVVEPGPARDHTERMLAHMGAPIHWAGGGAIELQTRGWDRHLAADAFEVPGDPSSAAFMVAAALVAGAERVAVQGVCVNATRTGFLDALDGMNALVELEARRDAGGEPTATLVVTRGAADELTPAVVEGDVVVRAIDELPVLAVVAARARGTTEFRDAAELRVKESDRIATTCAMLRAFGCEVEERPDGFAVEGKGGLPFTPCRVDAAGDHRIAMSAAVAALAADGEVRVDDVDNVATSFPTFAQLLAHLGADIETIGS